MSGDLYSNSRVRGLSRDLILIQYYRGHLYQTSSKLLNAKEVVT